MEWFKERTNNTKKDRGEEERWDRALGRKVWRECEDAETVIGRREKRLGCVWIHDRPPVECASSCSKTDVHAVPISVVCEWAGQAAPWQLTYTHTHTPFSSRVRATVWIYFRCCLWCVCVGVYKGVSHWLRAQHSSITVIVLSYSSEKSHSLQVQTKLKLFI